MQETQPTQQTTTRTAQNQDKKTNINVNGYKNTEDTQKQTNIYKRKMGVSPWNGQ